jgi:hypothetical protein
LAVFVAFSASRGGRVAAQTRQKGRSRSKSRESLACISSAGLLPRSLVPSNTAQSVTPCNKSTSLLRADKASSSPCADTAPLATGNRRKLCATAGQPFRVSSKCETKVPRSLEMYPSVMLSPSATSARLCAPSTSMVFTPDTLIRGRPLGGCISLAWLPGHSNVSGKA